MNVKIGDTPNTLNVVLVDDDDGDAKAVQRAFRQAKIANPITRYEDGLEALQSLRGEDGRTMPASPYILLVDINMPRMNGIELVQELRKDDRLNKAIVFMLTTSKREEDQAMSYDLNVAGYIVKETAGRDFLNLVELVESFWRVVELPTV